MYKIRGAKGSRGRLPIVRIRNGRHEIVRPHPVKIAVEHRERGKDYLHVMEKNPKRMAIEDRTKARKREYAADVYKIRIDGKRMVHG